VCLRERDKERESVCLCEKSRRDIRRRREREGERGGDKYCVCVGV